MSTVRSVYVPSTYMSEDVPDRRVHPTLSPPRHTHTVHEEVAPLYLKCRHMVEISQLYLKTEYMGKYTRLYLKRKKMGRVPADLNVEGVHGGSLPAHLPDEGVRRRPPPRLYLKREGLSPGISEEEASSRLHMSTEYMSESTLYLK
jgi:hypothetical protein